MNLGDPIEKLALVGPIYAKKLAKINILTIEDLLYHFPFRYDDFSLISPIGRVQPGETLTVRGRVEEIKNEYTKNSKKIQKATISDSSGKINIIWFNQPFLAKTIRVGENYNFSGKVNWFGRQKVLLSPEYEPDRGDPCHTGRLVPVYPETYGVSSKWLRSRLRQALEILGQVEEFLPEEIIRSEGLLDEKTALAQIHFPESKTLSEKARTRLAFDELFLIQLSILLRKKDWQKKRVDKVFAVNQDKVLDFIHCLPFELTEAQKRSLQEILDDLKKDQPMNRLLEGDVGSGKTVVAAAAAYVSFLNGRQTLLMAPTEILANQHYQTLKSLFEPLGIPITLITGSLKPKKNEERGPAGIIVGTHSLLYQEFDQKQIGLVVVDEQHRFGVEQRVLLAQKGATPHFLTMTATPIPRSVALTLFGDLDLSVIDELPAGRIKIKTWVVPPHKRKDCYHWIKNHLKEKSEQAFFVCPLIEESESLGSVRAAKKEFEALSKSVFPDLRLGLLHGKLKSKEKDRIITEFKEGRLDILVSTPVVEVGIDIPNASIMLVEGADRFGLAQLHQLRGRVGRNDQPSYCFLFTDSQSPAILSRLKSLETTNLGLQLAEIDLTLRGPGEIYGTKQHGLPDFRLASITDYPLIKKAKEAAEKTLKDRWLPPSLKNRLEKYKIDNVNN